MAESYQKFISHLKIEGGSMILESNPGVSVTYEQRNGISSSSNSLVPENIESWSKIDQGAALTSVPTNHSECSLVDESYQTFLTLLKTKGSSMILEYGNGVSLTSEKEKETGVSVSCEEENDTPFRSETLATEVTESFSKLDKAVVPSITQDYFECSLVEESYQKFLNIVKVEVNSMILEYKPGFSVTYETEKETGKYKSEVFVTSTRAKEANVSVTCEEEEGTPFSLESLATQCIRSFSKSDKVSETSSIPHIHCERSLVEGSYQKFLSLLKIEDNSMSLEYETGISGAYVKENKIGVSVTCEQEKICEEENNTSCSSENLQAVSTRSFLKSDKVAGTSFVPEKQCEYSLVEGSYQKLLSLLKIEDNSMSLEYEPGVYVTYDKEKETEVSVTYEKEKKSRFSVICEEAKDTSFSSENLAAVSTTFLKTDKGAGTSFVSDKQWECSLVEEPYQIFLSQLKIQDNLICLEYNPGVSVPYEKGEAVEHQSGTSVAYDKEKETSVSITCEEEENMPYCSESLATEFTRSFSKSGKFCECSFVPHKHCECSLIEESYLKFLSFLVIEDYSMGLKYEPGVSVIYEKEKTTEDSLTYEKERETSVSVICDEEKDVSSETLAIECTGSFLLSDKAADTSFFSNRHGECSLAEDSYPKFLSRLKIENNLMCLEYRPGSSVTYEKERNGEYVSGVSLTSEKEKKTSVSVTCEEEKDTLLSSEILPVEVTRSPSESDKAADSSFVLHKHCGCSLAEESYQKFLNLLIQDNLMSLEYEPGVFVKYEKGKVIDSANLPEEQELLLPVSSEVSCLTFCEDDSSSMLSCDFYDSSEYGEKLSIILSKPYDQNDYEDLWKKANARKPLIRLKHLRKTSKPYATNYRGMSYLDHFPDLARKMESADCYDRLTLLRGFFFWLERLCQEGAFKPWISLRPSYEITSTSDYIKKECGPDSENSSLSTECHNSCQVAFKPWASLRPSYAITSSTDSELVPPLENAIDENQMCIWHQVREQSMSQKAYNN